MCLNKHPILNWDDKPLIPFTFDGKPFMGRKGVPIGAALLDNGIDVFRYTEKTKAPRSVFCGIGQCNDCVVVVNGTPNVRACVTPLEKDMVVETQHGFGRIGVVK